MKKLIPLLDFKLTHSIARRIAENLWGTGGTDSSRTNRRGAYFFSCSGHGGYVVDPKCLSPDERDGIYKYSSCYIMELLTSEVNGVRVVDAVSVGSRTRKYKYRGINPEWIDYNYLCFEEDCDWSILENFTDIRVVGWQDGMSTTERNDLIFQTFNRYFGKNAEPYDYTWKKHYDERAEIKHGYL